MKPKFQIDRPKYRGDAQKTFRPEMGKSPAVDWMFQSPGLTTGGGGVSTSFQRQTSRPSFLPSFRTLSEGFFALEAKRESRLEGAVFAVIVALAAWPIVLAIQAAAGLTR